MAEQVPPEIPDEVVEEFIHTHPEGGSLEDIAATLGLTRQRVWQIVSRALAKCQRVVVERGVTPSDFPRPTTVWDRLERF